MNNFITYIPLITKALWLGKLPLYIAFWWFGVFGTYIIGLLLALILSVWEETSALQIFLIAIVSIGYQTVITVGIWRSADSYPGKKAYALAARFIVALYAVFAVVMLGYTLVMIVLFVGTLLNPPFIK